MKERNRNMRIGRAIIDFESMSIEELDKIISELRKIRKRKQEADAFMGRMNSLIAEAKQSGYTFIDKDFGNVLTESDLTIFDEQ